MTTSVQCQILASLTFAHVVTDFLLQTDRDVQQKRRIAALLKHSGVAAALSYVAVGLWLEWYLPIVIFITHCAIDYVKNSRFGRSFAAFLIDQVAHVLVIVSLSCAMQALLPPGRTAFWSVAGNWYSPSLILIAGFIVAVYAGSVVVGFAVEPFLAQLRQEQEPSDTESSPHGARSRRGFVSGGKVIGQLERALIFFFVLVEQPSGIGFLIAAKSLLRFGDIGAGASRKEVEYVIIGTLLSFLFGLAASYLTSYLVSILI